MNSIYVSMFGLSFVAAAIRGRYRLLATFEDHARAVMSLDFSDGGVFLASGGKSIYLQNEGLF